MIDIAGSKIKILYSLLSSLSICMMPKTASFPARISSAYEHSTHNIYAMDRLLQFPVSNMTPYTIFSTVSFFILGIGGTISNLFIIGAIIIDKQLKNLGNVFIVNLAVVDLLVTATVFPILSANTIAGNILPNYVCIISGTIALGGSFISIVNIAAIAFERYVEFDIQGYENFNVHVIFYMIICSKLNFNITPCSIK